VTTPWPELFRRYPALAERVPWIPLGTFPTPIEPCRVEAPDGSVCRVWVKREDRSSALYGGNKVRKLEFLLAEARRRGAKRLITVGAAASHHAFATLVHGRAAGFDCTLVLFPQPFTQHVEDMLRLDAAFGADIVWVPRMELVPVALLRVRLAHWRTPSFNIAAGGSDATGTLGWVSGGLELAAQIDAGDAPRPACIHVAGGTLGTAAGLAVGLALAGCDVPVVATRITSRLITNERVLGRLIAGVTAVLESAGVRVPSVDSIAARVAIRHDQIGRGYGHETDASRQALDTFSDVGLRLEPTYTAKACAELLRGAGTGEPVLFVHSFSAVEPTPPEGIVEPPEAVLSYLARSRG
jgi:D-cysteine desulfhydrase